MPYIEPRDRKAIDIAVNKLVSAIVKVAQRTDVTAIAGGINYALTRLLQCLPVALVRAGLLTQELRYWFQPLFYGVLLDVALEHKRRVNTSYEAHQIVKNGDCYDTPYYTKLVEVIGSNGEHIGYQEIMIKRDNFNVSTGDTIGKLVISKEK